METSVEQRGDVVALHITGAVDANTAEGLQQIFMRQVASGHHRLVADLAGVDYTSSAGLRVLLATVKDTRSRGGDLRLAAPHADVRKVLDLSGFSRILRVFATVDEAVQSFGGSGRE